MKLFLDYLNRIKFHILLMIFPTIFTGIIFFCISCRLNRSSTLHSSGFWQDLPHV